MKRDRDEQTHAYIHSKHTHTHTHPPADRIEVPPANYDTRCFNFNVAEEAMPRLSRNINTGPTSTRCNLSHLLSKSRPGLVSIYITCGVSLSSFRGFCLFSAVSNSYCSKSKKYYFKMYSSVCICSHSRLLILVSPLTRGYIKERSRHVMISTHSQLQQRASPCWWASQLVRCSS